MLKIKANRVMRQEVRELAAEFMALKFQELKGDYNALDARIDALLGNLNTLQTTSVTEERLAKLQEKYAESIQLMQESVRTAIENIDTDLQHELQLRLEFVEEKLGI